MNFSWKIRSLSRVNHCMREHFIPSSISSESRIARYRPMRHSKEEIAGYKTAAQSCQRFSLGKNASISSKSDQHQCCSLVLTTKNTEFYSMIGHHGDEYSHRSWSIRMRLIAVIKCQLSQWTIERNMCEIRDPWSSVSNFETLDANEQFLLDGKGRSHNVVAPCRLPGYATTKVLSSKLNETFFFWPDAAWTRRLSRCRKYEIWSRYWEKISCSKHNE